MAALTPDMKKIIAIFRTKPGNNGGFSLVEFIVAVGLFTIVVSIAVGGFTGALRTQRQAVGLISANSNISLALEQMTREMRTGYDFCANGRTCLLPEEIEFKNAKNEIVRYCFASDGDTGWVERGVGGGACSSENFKRITADNVSVEHLKFYVSGNLPASLPPPAGDELQPRITISIGVTSKEKTIAGNPVDLQTTVSPRLPLDM